MRVSADIVAADGSHKVAAEPELFSVPVGHGRESKTRHCVLESALPGAGPPLRALSVGGLMEEGGTLVPLFSIVTQQLQEELVSASASASGDAPTTRSFTTVPGMATNEDAEEFSSARDSSSVSWIIPEAPVRLVPDNGGAPPPGALSVDGWFVVLAATTMGKVPAQAILSAEGDSAKCTFWIAGGEEECTADRFEWCCVVAAEDEAASAVGWQWNVLGVGAHTIQSGIHRYYLCVQPDGKTEHRAVAAEWETVIVEEIRSESDGPGRQLIALRSHHGKYLRVHLSGDMQWIGSTISALETIEVVPNTAGVALKSAHGSYLCAMTNGSLRFTAHDVRSSETFLFARA